MSALMRQGDNFDYYKWLQTVREEEAEAKQVPATFTLGEIKAAKRGNPISAPGFEGALPICALITRMVPITGRSRSHDEPAGKTSKALRRRLDKSDAWDDFQASRARDAVYGFLGAVFEMVMHYKVRRRTTRLRRHAFKFAELPFNRNADPFSAVIRCTSDDNADSKTISKWARALRYVARCKVSPTQLKTFMKEAAGVNACASLYARRCKRDNRRSPRGRN
jgi:hypothetical protein